MTDDGPDPDAEKREFLREIADELRGDSGESEQVAALLYRVSDVYDEDEETDPRDVYVNMRTILRVRERTQETPDPEGV
ncbi:hypothetical protein BRC81_00835 [Halobacteriales archaeon QS_1_68_20]|nr:MAG: hypothetical protein BRC81_00835 [Halobacteriales archaeon QS_1_68_20]